MGLVQTILPHLSLSSSLLLSLLTAIFFLALIRRLYFHPLSHIPGPLLARCTSLFLYTVSYLGIECRVFSYYHQKYQTQVLRVAPNSVSISDGSAIHTIYVAGGGFLKDSRYENFNLEGCATIFSTRDPGYRDIRAKAVLPMFASGRVRRAGEKEGVMRNCVEQYVRQFQMEKDLAKKSGAVKVDILDLSAKLSVDVVTKYLFGRSFGGLDEHAENLRVRSEDWEEGKKTAGSKLSLNPFIFTVVAFGRFSLFPNWLFKLCYRASIRLSADEKVFASLGKLGRFVKEVVDDANPGKYDTYQARLLAAGISEDETIKQCKAVMFAGTDSTSVKLATIIFHIVQNPPVLEKLKAEVQEAGIDREIDPQSLPYLRAVIKEGLRLGVANPARLTRVVPNPGFEVSEYYIPPGTIVGIAPWMVHHNPSLFPEPFKFRPERWLEEHKDPSRRAEMERDLIPFGTGSRACLARNLALQQLHVSVRALVESGVLEGARTCKERIEIVEWFNAEIRGHELEIQWE